MPGVLQLKRLFLFPWLITAAVFSGSSVGAQPRFELGDPVLLMAAQEGMVAVVERRLKHGATVDARDALGRTPLIVAARNNHERLVKVLLQNGADAELTDGMGHTAVTWAIKRGHLMVAHTVLSALRGTPAYDRQVYLALEAARERGDEKTLVALEEIYADAEPPPEPNEVDPSDPGYAPPGSDERVDEPWPRPAWPQATRPPGAAGGGW